MWTNIRDERGREQDKSLWKGQIISPLEERPFVGRELLLMADNVHDGSATIIHISHQFEAYQGTKGEPSRVGDFGFPLPKQILFVTPSFTTLAIHQQFEQQGGHWHYEAYRQYYRDLGPLPPQPSENSLSNEGGERLYDVMTVSRLWGEHLPPATRLTFVQVLQLTEYVEQTEDAMLFRYYAGPQPSEGNAIDSLEWVNPHYVPWKPRRGYVFHGYYFTTTASVVAQDGSREEVFPKMFYLVTLFQQDQKVTRPFGDRDEAVKWVKRTPCRGASLARYVPDPSVSIHALQESIVEDAQDLVESAFIQEGEAEWLKREG